MSTTESVRETLWDKFKKFAATIGPGIFILGYTVGTGSVTTMATSGADYGLSLSWAVGLSCIFTYILIVSIGRATIVQDQTLITSFKNYFGKPITLFIIVGLMLTVISSVMGIMGIVSNIVQEWTRIITPAGNGIHPIFTAAFCSGLLYYLFWNGQHNFFLKAIAVIVAIMSASFIITMIIVFSNPQEVLPTFIPSMPTGEGGHLILAGMVGTTMATVVVVTRTYLVAEQGWTMHDLREEKRDAKISLTMTFIVSVAIIAAAAGTMFPLGIHVENAIDMVKTLEPLAGQFATSLFVVGLVAAGLSSTFPNYVLGPWLVLDYLNLPREMTSRKVRIGVFIVALTGLIVPVFGGQPVIIMIASQAVSPVIMPLLIALTYVLLNTKANVQDYKNPKFLNIGLIVAFLFSLFISYSAIVGLFDFVSNLG